MKESNKIIEVAERFLGLYEVKSNAIWDDPSTAGEDPQAKILLELMIESGWQPGYAYCCSLTEAVWRQAYYELDAPQDTIDKITTNLTPSVMKSFNNWKKEELISTIPTSGSIFFMQKGFTGFGHAGIVVKSSDDGKKISTIEGNTSPDPASVEADREGDGVFRRVRPVSFTSSTGLWMQGFLHPIVIQDAPVIIDLPVVEHTPVVSQKPKCIVARAFSWIMRPEDRAIS